MADTILVSPSSYEIGSTETLALSFDVSGDLSGSETAVSAVSSLVNRQSGDTYDDGLVGDPEIDVDGSLITQVVANLQAGHKYRLVITFVVTPDVKEPACALLIDCPF